MKLVCCRVNRSCFFRYKKRWLFYFCFTIIIMETLKANLIRDSSSEHEHAVKRSSFVLMCESNMWNQQSRVQLNSMIKHFYFLQVEDVWDDCDSAESSGRKWSVWFSSLVTVHHVIIKSLMTLLNTDRFFIKYINPHVFYHSSLLEQFVVPEHFTFSVCVVRRGKRDLQCVWIKNKRVHFINNNYDK